MMWIIICGIVLYTIGFLLGRKYEKDAIMDGVYGVLSQINKSNMLVDSVTYYYNKEVYDQKIKELKELGEDYYE